MSLTIWLHVTQKSTNHIFFFSQNLPLNGLLDLTILSAMVDFTFTALVKVTLK